MLASLAVASEDPNLNQILQKHLDAMGGLRNWSQVESIRLSGTVERDGQIIDIVIVKKRPQQIRATLTLPVHGKEDESLQVIRAHDGKEAWTATRMAGAPKMIKKSLIGEAADDLLADAGVLPPLIKHWRANEDLKLIGSDSLYGEHVFVIEYTQESGTNTQHFYLSAQSYRTLAYDSHTSTKSIHTRLYDYQKQDGVWLPMRSVITAERTGASTMQMNSIEIGVGIYDAYFEADPSVETADL
jgi:hypothetical protein